VVTEAPEKAKEMVPETPSPQSPQDQKPTATKSNGETPVESHEGVQESEDLLDKKTSSQASSPQELQVETQGRKAPEHAGDDLNVEEIPSPDKMDEEKPSQSNDLELEESVLQGAEGSKKVKLSEDNDNLSIKSGKSKESDKLSKASNLSKAKLKFYEKEGEKIKQAVNHQISLSISFSSLN